MYSNRIEKNLSHFNEISTFQLKTHILQRIFTDSDSESMSQ